MVVIVGGVIVLVSVLVGFSMAGGKIGALIHLSEFVTIGGATLGSLIMMSPVKVIKDLIRGALQTVKGSPYGKAACVELLKLQYALARLVRQEGLLALDSHITNPDGSALLREYPKLNGNHHAREFLCDSLALILDGTVESSQLTEWLEEEIQVVEREHNAAVDTLSKTADSLPGFGIVAAVLGIVVTMQAIGGPVEEIGYKVGAALVGTFLGILAAYGFVAPMAARMHALGDQEILFLKAMAVGVVAMNDGASPKDVVARARRVISTDCRPNQAELKTMFS
ncbi:Motility protein A [Gemmata obscuriglobus]|uniref:Flagellar motor stator protein MotA n=1 Tax=Gemmata obscuriglobus TaxID=114 RepID=A0A2Z3GSB8_9BACT|nr:flagellar motor stator protein MotA [Gemmata obscuriglobus]AWM37269.1 flagellar motor stator protein MotA [Gemmata obscuriglobus]QEG29987.1 Motility protein A [Gemmata obscuriglobus]VTS09305.1 flagellar motor protein : MotA/TolQ/ExbB proton channel OS=Planctomyces limnophilus (strain ATCC 43296 / DSM 3776 / IFAM 1008 / 290) GN=Plim_2583 PE=4 SV=1: MotA_ExbB [Gemmata obscuriglobus UQM 2246]